MTRLAAVLAGLLAVAACGGERDPSAPPSVGRDVPCVEIPGEADWEYVGVAFEAGPEGAFDQLLWGGFGGSPIRFGGETLLYYQGARGYSEFQQSVRLRSIGLAVTTDGKSFAKAPESPVLEWTPTGGEEEGVASIAVAAGRDGGLVVFYGANTMFAEKQVHADARWATSRDGRTFEDRGVALAHDDPRVAGSGDELFPVIAFRHDDAWFVYYLPNGAGEPRGRLKVATGARPDTLTTTAPVLDPAGRPVRAWGMQSAVHVCGETYALFLSDVDTGAVTVRTIDARAPHAAGDPLATYRFPPSGSRPGMIQGAVVLDREARAWTLFYRTDDGAAYAVRRAPVVER